MSDTTPPSLWRATACSAPSTSVLDDDLEVDVAIVGAGYSGLSSALHLAELGMRVAVLEAEELGHGGSGRNMGQVNAGFLMLPEAVKSYLGAEIGELMNEAFCRSPDIVFDLIERFAMDCDAQRNGNLFLAHNTRSLSLIQSFYEQHTTMGAQMERLDYEATQSAVGSPKYTQAVLDRRAGTLQPMSYARELARAAISLGAQIFTNTRVEKLKQTQDTWVISTESGHRVRADKAILATDSYSEALWPGLNKALVPVTAQQIATAPLSENLAQSIVPDARGTADRMSFTHYFRKDAENRLLMVTGGPTSPDVAVLKRFFPQLGDVKIEYAWSGLVSMSKDHLPRVYLPAPGLYVPMGYSGRGVSSGTLMGRLLAEHLVNSLPLPMPSGPLQQRYLPGLQSAAMGLALNTLRRMDNWFM